MSQSLQAKTLNIIYTSHKLILLHLDLDTCLDIINGYFCLCFCQIILLLLLETLI